MRGARLDCENTQLRSSFFFFQAEDGIRDHCVTGVQTCALPILRYCVHGVGGDVLDVFVELAAKSLDEVAHKERKIFGALAQRGDLDGENVQAVVRSEERRVGEEGRSPWSADHLKKKKRKEL